MDNFYVIWPHYHDTDGNCQYVAPVTLESREKAIGWLLSQGVKFHSARWAVEEGAWIEEALVKGRHPRRWFTVTISSLTYRNGEAL